jgi:hypothetical protein
MWQLERHDFEELRQKDQLYSVYFCHWELSCFNC